MVEAEKPFESLADCRTSKETLVQLFCEMGLVADYKGKPAMTMINYVEYISPHPRLCQWFKENCEVADSINRDVWVLPCVGKYAKELTDDA